MAIPTAFEVFTAEVVKRHFKDAPLPDGTPETNLTHLRMSTAALRELENCIYEMALSGMEDFEYRRFAEERARAGIYDLYQMSPRQNTQPHNNTVRPPGQP